MSMLTTFQKKKLTHLFHFFDRDGNGFIEPKELDQIVDNLAISEDEAEQAHQKRLQQMFHRFWRQLIDAADENGDGKISLEEFVEVHEVLIADSASYQRYVYPFIESLFHLIDLDKDKCWDKKEFTHFYRLCKQSENYAEEAFSKMDANKDGFLSHLEVIFCFREFYLSNDKNAVGNNFFGKMGN